jgi:Ketoacyl-synthetase C-terminal extension
MGFAILSFENSTNLVCLGQFPLELTPWPTTGLRRVSVNSFGFGGTNAHAILDDAHHYLRSRSTPCHHSSSVGHQSYTNGTMNGTTNGTTNCVNGTHGQNGTKFESLTGAANGVNGIHKQNSIHAEIPSGSANSVNGIHAQNDTDTTDLKGPSNPPSTVNGVRAHNDTDSEAWSSTINGVNRLRGQNGTDSETRSSTIKGVNGLHGQNGSNSEARFSTINAVNGFHGQNGSNSKARSSTINSVNGLHGQNGTDSKAPPGTINGVHADDTQNSAQPQAPPGTTNRVDGFHAQNSTESDLQPCHGNDASCTQPPSVPKILTFSTMDENGLKRLSSIYDRYFASLNPTKSSDRYLDRLAHTVNNRRSALLWRSFALVKSVSDLQSQGLRLSKPRRLISNPRLAFCFTGQGAQWFAMGRELLSFSIFKDSLEDMDAYLSDLGCSWSLLGKPNQILKSQFPDPQQMNFVETRQARKLTILHTANHYVLQYKWDLWIFCKVFRYNLSPLSVILQERLLLRKNYHLEASNSTEN